MSGPRMLAPRILVLGGEGQIARSFQDLGRAEIVCVGRPNLDVTDLASLIRTVDRVKPDIVVNPAAYTAVDKAENEQALAFAVNESGARNAARAAAGAGLPIVHVSTDYVFDGEKGGPYEPGDPTNPINAYARSKLAGEQAVAEANPRHAIVRTAWVYSPYGTNFVKTMLRLGRERPELRIVDDQRGNPTEAGDIARGLALIAERAASTTGAGDWGVYHLAGADETTWFGFAQAIFEASSARGGPSPALRPIATSDYPTPARRARNTRLKTSSHGLMQGVSVPGFRARIGDVVSRLL
jgi:dTDP-4-dehydrorhamnose reductase